MSTRGMALRSAPVIRRSSCTVQWKVLPRPGSLLTPISPPMASTMRFDRASPSPLPAPASPGFTWEKGRKSRACPSALMPTPVSRTSTRMVTVSGGVGTTGGWGCPADGRAGEPRGEGRDERGAQDDLPARRELEGVAHQVHQHLAQAGGIAAQRGHVAGDAGDQLDASLPRAIGAQLAHLVDEAAQVEIDALELEFTRLVAAEIEDVVDEAHQRVGEAAHPLHVVALLGRELGVEEQPRQPDDARDQGAQLVAELGEGRALEALGRQRRAQGRDLGGGISAGSRSLIGAALLSRAPSRAEDRSGGEETQANGLRGPARSAVMKRR